MVERELFTSGKEKGLWEDDNHQMGFFGPGGLFKTRLDSYNIHHIFEGDSTVECTFGI